MNRASLLSLLMLACTSGSPGKPGSGASGGGTGSDGSSADSGAPADDTSGTGSGTGGDDSGGDDSGGTGGSEPVPCPEGPDPFADAVVTFDPGASAGFGADRFPDVVLGCPRGGGTSGSLDVLSLGQDGVIVLEFTDLGIVDGEGPDLLVFENAFPGWPETGIVAVSNDGETWHEWPCDPDDVAGGFPGCAGVENVFANPANDVDMTDPAEAGGDAFDLADLGIERARFVRIRDSGRNPYAGSSGGFDLDAVGIVHSEPL